MANRIEWNASGNPSIDHYLLDRSASETGPWANVASVDHDLGDPTVYDPALGKFFFLDNAGAVGSWYRVIEVDTLSQQSNPVVFQYPAAIDLGDSQYQFSKQPDGATYPLGAIASAWGDVEPLITPDQLKARHLFGIPLYSYQKDPITGKRQAMTDPILRDVINRAVAVAEVETHLEIMPRLHREKMPFDRQQYAALGYMMLPTHPVRSLEKLSVTASNGSDLYLVPPDWVEVAYIHTGQINIIPMTVAFQYGGFFVPSNSPNGGSAFLAILGQNPWIPAYWQVEWTTGFADGKLPLIVNELVGIIAAIDVLGLLATTNARNSSHSVGMDGLSQSISTPGPQIYDARIALLKEQKDRLVNKIRLMYGTKMFTGVI